MLQRQSHKWRWIFAEVQPNFGRIVTCCRAEHLAELRLLPNFGPSLLHMQLQTLLEAWTMCFQKKPAAIPLGGEGMPTVSFWSVSWPPLLLMFKGLVFLCTVYMWYNVYVDSINDWHNASAAGHYICYHLRGSTVGCWFWCKQWCSKFSLAAKLCRFSGVDEQHCMRHCRHRGVYKVVSEGCRWI